jgi:hypothetical protein
MKTRHKIIIGLLVLECAHLVRVRQNLKREEEIIAKVAWDQADLNNRITNMQVDRFDKLDPWEPANWALLTRAMNNDLDDLSPEDRKTAQILYFEFRLLKPHR